MNAKSLYIASHERASGSLVVAMGLMEYLKGANLKVAFFRPFVQSTTFDHDINYFLQRYKLDMHIDQCHGYSVHEAENLIAQNRLSFMMERLIEQYKTLESEYDFVLVEGIYRAVFSQAIDIDLNLEAAKNFGTPYIAVLSGKDKAAYDIYDEILIENESIKASGCSHFATFANRLDPTVLLKLQSQLKQPKEASPIFFTT
jgi:phosphate acetyltransferase